MELLSDKIKIKDLLEWKRGNILRVNPEYQRGAVWKEGQQKKLIDSVLRSYPLPLIYLHYKKQVVAGITREDFEVIDGQQRINALNQFAEGAIKLFDPIKDDNEARFPQFIKDAPCSWAHCYYHMLSEDLRNKFDDTEIFIVKITTNNDDEARDLFIRLQAGLPLNAQEKRDAWPGGYTEFVLRYGGKKEIPRYPGDEFFRKIVANPSSDRGEVRTICAQIGMLFFEEATKGNWMNIATKNVDDYYYQKLNFNVYGDNVIRFGKVLHVATSIFNGYKGPKLKVHEAIHVILLIDSLLDDYISTWQSIFTTAFDEFRHRSAVDKRVKNGEYWYSYVALTMTSAANAATIQTRHEFFSEKMLKLLKPIKKDSTRIYGQVEREILYFKYKKLCVVCGKEIEWKDLEIHHINEHQNGGETILDNGVPVHKFCHPKGATAEVFYKQWTERKANEPNTKVNSGNILEENLSPHLRLENIKKNVLAFATITDGGKITVLKGSRISADTSQSFEESCEAAAKRRYNLIQDGGIDKNFEFTRDVVFNSKSNAASLILGFSANGNTEWKQSNIGNNSPIQ